MTRIQFLEGDNDISSGKRPERDAFDKCDL